MTFKPTKQGDGRIKFFPDGAVKVRIDDISSVKCYNVTKNGATIEHDIKFANGHTFYASFRDGGKTLHGIDMHATEGIPFEITDNGATLLLLGKQN